MSPRVLIRRTRRLLRGPRHALAQRMINRADEARDTGDFRAAAVLYEEALDLGVTRADIHVQAGHMFKEAGDLPNAERLYLRARAIVPEDADLALQLGHFYKLAERYDDAETSYARALELKPEWADPMRELADLHRRRGRGLPDEEVEAPVPGLASESARLVPELFPRAPQERAQKYADSIHIRRFGARRERSRWGMIQTFRGVEALRGFCISSAPLREVVVLLAGKPIDASPLQAFDLPGDADHRKYVFNIWHDFSDIGFGRYQVELRFMSEDGAAHSYREHVVVAAPLSEADYPDSDTIITLAAGDAGSAEERVNARPSVVRPAARSVFPAPPRNVLVLRTDQLGDMVCSIPAMRRLREILPEANIVGLLTASNVELARTLGLFDEIIVVDFPDDWDERRRIMPAAAQEALRARLEPYVFDLAIDLAESFVSRPLMLLSGARLLYGFHDRDWPWLSAGFSAHVHDPKNYMEVAPQSTKVLAMVERLSSLLGSKAEVIRRADLGWDGLAPYGIAAGDRFAVLHTGARIGFSRWPFYAELATLLLRGTDLTVVILTDGGDLRASLPADLIDSGRLKVIDGIIPFDAFDALLSFCALFIGNDSGPKHLAALRGAKVVSLHSARINWNEWGQELTGSIVSRKVPCGGCTIFHDAEECGKGFACIVRITPDEVYAAATALL